MQHTSTHCHCGADRKGSDHCPECGCEEFESTCDHVHVGSPTYVVIHGNHTSAKTAVDYVAAIVYGHPRIEAVAVGSHFVALCDFPASQYTWAKGTFERMGSFPHGASLTHDKAEALKEFGTWVYHWAPGTIVGIEPTPLRGYCEDKDCPSYGEALVNGLCPAVVA